MAVDDNVRRLQAERLFEVGMDNSAYLLYTFHFAIRLDWDLVCLHQIFEADRQAAPSAHQLRAIRNSKKSVEHQSTPSLRNKHAGTL